MELNAVVVDGAEKVEVVDDVMLFVIVAGVVAAFVIADAGPGVVVVVGVVVAADAAVAAGHSNSISLIFRCYFEQRAVYAGLMPD